MIEAIHYERYSKLSFSMLSPGPSQLSTRFNVAIHAFQYCPLKTTGDEANRQQIHMHPLAVLSQKPNDFFGT